MTCYLRTSLWKHDPNNIRFLAISKMVNRLIRRVSMCDGYLQGQMAWLSCLAWQYCTAARALLIICWWRLLSWYVKNSPGYNCRFNVLAMPACLFLPTNAFTVFLMRRISVRQRFAQGQTSRDELLEPEVCFYHSAGTCTFYGTAIPNSSWGDDGFMPRTFSQSNDPTADALTKMLLSYPPRITS